MKRSRFSIIAVFLLAVCCATSYAADTREETGAKGVPSHDHGTWKEKRAVARMDADGVQRMEMVGGEYYYEPNYIVVKLNKPVELKFKKAAGYIPHNLKANSPEAGIVFNLEMKSDPQTVKFTPAKTGKYPIFCDKSLLWFKTHRERGMEGIIEVVE